MLIISAIAINSFADKQVRKIILAGADMLRFNFSYRTIAETIQWIKIAQETRWELNSSIKLLIDLPSEKIRLGNFDLKTHTVKEGEEIIFRSADYSPDCNQFVPVQTVKLGEKTYVDKMIAVGDGDISIQVMEIIDTDTIKVRMLNNGVLQAMKVLHINTVVNEQKLLEYYKQIFQHMDEIQPHYIAVPFINDSINQQIIAEIPQKNRYKTIIKIENQEGLNRMETLCQDTNYDMILVDRGELGVNLPYEELGVIQKNIIHQARQYRKPVIISTQILESTMNNYIPKRSDILDLTNIILDGADGIMFCRETGLGLRPAYTISVAKRIIQAVEKYKQKAE
ncbi:MAG: hypothetical protein A2921_00160 [Candidatus Magasanikbacteria bacterium RIFCSPLOWO2_01_FULL_43_20b]|uniref:Pyruvate kinase n=1 Tax=Candidatus Magasanikbacteria bacterium RIFCSPLOWO2_12_FULL_43_12 TaxID=1798692 RepID=A0A1F6MRA1_9BACT|nr:MAG: hypothetical protein A2921_00160 [Candidatus Magasanikbacteria bacterium RIFCSPLOWO2_01_FULL_43_20b]OGH74157.1 MAG: hypothetical protein A3G00_03005 [Candidatus Magasanikbacteria bacterium RIFCSPLOWO2_12_FULL_43_12]